MYHGKTPYSPQVCAPRACAQRAATFLSREPSVNGSREKIRYTQYCELTGTRRNRTPETMPMAANIVTMEEPP